MDMFGRNTVFKPVRRRCEIPYTCPDDNAGAHLLDADVTGQALGHRIRRAPCALLVIGLGVGDAPWRVAGSRECSGLSEAWEQT